MRVFPPKITKAFSGTTEYTYMHNKDQRRFKRVETSNLVSYISTDKNGTELDEHMARAINVSSGGVLIETFQRINSEYVWLTSIDLEDHLIEIKGKVVYCRKVEDGLYEAGIRFQGTFAENKEFARKMVHVFTNRKTTFVTATPV